MLFPKPTKTIKKKRGYIRSGKKTNEWNAARRIMITAYRRAGITYCEVGKYLSNDPRFQEIMEAHNHTFFITFAHGSKRRNLVGDELLTFAVAACIDCHNMIEYRDDMGEIVRKIIASRSVQPEFKKTKNYLKNLS